jgi:hypothetical protein
MTDFKAFLLASDSWILASSGTLARKITKTSLLSGD